MRIKKLLFLIISLPLISGLTACSQSNAGEQRHQNSENSSETIAEGKVEVYYFHFTRRCVSCVTVQQTTEKVLAEHYSEEMENGSLVYHEINLSDPESREIAGKLGVGGQALIVVSGNKVYDLTMQGFMLAARDYNRFKDTLDTAIAKVKT